MACCIQRARAELMAAVALCDEAEALASAPSDRRGSVEGARKARFTLKRALARAERAVTGLEKAEAVAQELTWRRDDGYTRAVFGTRLNREFARLSAEAHRG